MGWEAIFSLSLVGGMLAVLALGQARPEWLLPGTLAAMMAAGVLGPADALSGVVNPAVMTVGALFIVAGGLAATGLLAAAGNRLLGPARCERAAMGRMAATVLPASALLNNTPIVAMMIPVVGNWCRLRGIRPARLMIPLSYLAILGGTCTLIGTSTNLIVHGMMVEAGLEGIGMFEISRVGLPLALAGVLFLMLAAGRLLPDRSGPAEKTDTAVPSDNRAEPSNSGADPRCWAAVGVIVLLVGLLVTRPIRVETAALLAAGLMILLGCIGPIAAVGAVQWRVLITIAAAFGLGKALVVSGAAPWMVESALETVGPWGPLAVLAGLYLATWALTEIITNNAAAALMFPFALEAANLLGVDARPFMLTLAVAASASFTTPIGYQTNMMVFSPGGYRFGDYLRVGLPLNLVLWVLAVTLIPRAWPF